MSRQSIYEQALGTDYLRLPAAVQRFHTLKGHTVLRGWVETGAPESVLARCLALCLGSPRSTSAGPLRFELITGPDKETWTRHFPTRTMSSQMTLAAGHLVERLGAAQLTFRLTANENGLSMKLLTLRFFGVSCPHWLMPQVVAEETGAGDRLQFHVKAALPFVGTVAWYRGHLEVSPEEQS